ncbi:hypothetical protein Fleli_2523 [Bernardetia litoralis DSM 6794]|uniref:PD-(D/E)XK endonuclease-like domain-containing protein n=1 Tax=Bernardetia litoralis (strain ATCC 23117 / DSM 6794 / NBRC 15988 / NCIMB 1366 / Fx l1 / Sio-4) TaxID=880071 RepID=I4ALQ3_BERLS|nr:hypothetical protein [Bernardetia litoralis]AFM04888.1 hypothetical protein Fleli_2523 [Bernardetia litoralis DSM 6794]
MNDYIKYIDSNSIKLGKIAFEMKDYNFSLINYKKAIKRLKRYRGNDKYPLHLINLLDKKLTEIEEQKKQEENKNNVQSNLKYQNWKLSKSSFIKGKQCIKYLYLDKHKKKERTPPSPKTLELFKKGHQFEDFFREQNFENGINVKENLGFNFGYFSSYTDFLLEQNEKITLFEATFVENDILVMCDVVDKIGKNLYDFYEIKSHTHMQEVIWNDLAIQYFICKQKFGEKAINTFNVVLRDENNEGKIIDAKDELEGRIGNMNSLIKNFKNVLSSQEPIIEMGKQCLSPYKCDFMAYCEKLKENS